tara:strand:+ start:262763 stop:263563 length:801 start_codon:yes stop_codon:yes gene_type:complete
MRLYFTSILALVVFCSSAAAYNTEQIKSQLKSADNGLQTSRVVEVIDGDTLVLENNVTVRLVGLQAPKIALGRENFKEWPLGYEAKDALRDLTLGKTVSLYYGGREMDRYGRALAHLFLDDGTWVQSEMLNLGMARVYSFSDNRSVVGEMLEIEKKARSRSDGIWALRYYSIVPQQQSGRLTNSFQIISGNITEVATVRSNTYLNFGDDYKTDFTIVIPNKVKKMFEQLDINLSELAGKNVIVRGWLKYYNGPSINLSHPEQLVIE